MKNWQEDTGRDGNHTECMVFLVKAGGCTGRRHWAADRHGHL